MGVFLKSVPRGRRTNHTIAEYVADQLRSRRFPFLITPYASALPDAPIRFVNRVVQFQLPEIYDIQGRPIFAPGRSTDVAPNTEADLLRFQQELADQTPGKQVSPLSVFGMDTGFRNGYIVNYSASLEQEMGDFKLGPPTWRPRQWDCPGVSFPNNYNGADPVFARSLTMTHRARWFSGIGQELLMSSDRSHSTFH